MAKKEVVLLDGGFSTQLAKYVGEQLDGDPLWTAKFLAQSPEKCICVHKDFVLAGANIISTGSYQATVEGYKRYLNMDMEQSLQVIRNSVQLARQGIEMAHSETGQTYNVKVAGSVGPYGAFLHNGSEYTGSYTNEVTTEKLIEWHRPRVEALIAAGVDVLAFETIPCYKEAEALIKLLKEFPHAKAWVSFSIKNSSSVSNGESFYDNIMKCWKESSQLIATGANCFNPSLVSSLFKDLTKNHPSLSFITYPNKGETYDTQSKQWLNPENSVSIESYIKEWMDLGITYIGGCCRTDDHVICRMAQDVKKWNQQIYMCRA